jgi:hypothetical protein
LERAMREDGGNLKERRKIYPTTQEVIHPLRPTIFITKCVRDIWGE